VVVAQGGADGERSRMNDASSTATATCSRCGYDTRGLAAGVPCTECGRPVSGFAFPGRWARTAVRQVFVRAWSLAAAATVCWIIGCVGFPLAVVARGTALAAIVGFLALGAFVFHFILAGLALGSLLRGSPGEALPRYGIAVAVLCPALGLVGFALEVFPVGSLDVFGTPSISIALLLGAFGIASLVDAARRTGFRPMGRAARVAASIGVVLTSVGVIALKSAPIAQQWVVAAAFLGGNLLSWSILTAVSFRLAREIVSKE